MVTPAGRRLDPDARDRLAALSPRVAAGQLAAERALPVHEALSSLLPQGLVRGSTIGCEGRGAPSAALLAAAAASRSGSWLGVVGLPVLGVQACAEAGIALDRLVLVREPLERDGGRGWDDDTWGQVLGALVDGFDIVVLGAAARLRPGTARRVQSRLSSRGAVLVVVGAPGALSCDVRVAARSSWHGLGAGHGHLRARRLELVVEGRRVPRPRRGALWFPDAEGRIVPCAPDVASVAAPAPGAVARAG